MTPLLGIFRLIPWWVPAGIAALLAAGLWVQTHRIGQLTDALVEQRAKVATLEASEREWSAQAEAAVKDSAAKLKQAREQVKGAKAEVTRLQARILAAEHSTCGPAVQEIRDALGGG